MPSSPPGRDAARRVSECRPKSMKQSSCAAFGLAVKLPAEACYRLQRTLLCKNHRRRRRIVSDEVRFRSPRLFRRLFERGCARQDHLDPGAAARLGIEIAAAAEPACYGVVEDVEDEPGAA